MAHLDNPEAGGAPVDTLDSAAAALSNIFASDESDDDRRQDDDTQSTDEGEQADDGELDLSEDEGEQDSDEPDDSSAIEAPASLNLDEKARFAQLPKEAQRLLTDVEARRNGQVQSATTKAADAQRAAEARAAQADAQAKAVYATQLKTFADSLAPQRPDPSLAHTDPATYIALNAQYDAARAQHDEFVQQVTALGQEAESQMSQAEVAERDRYLMSLPEIQNEETKASFFEKAFDVANALGLERSALNQATGPEWQKLRQIHDWKDKAVKYDTAMAKQMQRVRDGKRTQAARPNAAKPAGGERAYRDATQRAKQSGSVDDAAKAIARLG